MRICDLKVTRHKSKSSAKKAKGKKTQKLNKSVPPMKGIYWNSRGLSDLAKYRYISDAIRDHKLDFVAVMETGK